jgi:hypothetical protein
MAALLQVRWAHQLPARWRQLHDWLAPCTQSQERLLRLQPLLLLPLRVLAATPHLPGWTVLWQDGGPLQGLN